MIMKRIIVYLHVVSILILAGYLSSVCWAEGDEVKDYFYDRIGDLMLVGSANDLYVVRLDTGKRRKVTSTTDIRELDAFLANGGALVVYKAERKKSAFDKKPSYEYDLYMQPVDKTDLNKERIDYFLYRD